MNKNETVLEVKDLSVSFRMYDRGLKQYELNIIKKMNLSLHKGELLAIVGASGSGKSVLAHAALGLLPENAIVRGDIYLEGKKLDKKLRKEKVGKEMIMIPQSLTYLDPLMKVGKQADGHRRPRQTMRRKKLFSRLELPEKTQQMYPFQLSGGMARRMLVSTALLTDAQLIIADEPTPGMSLDQALEALQMFREMI